MKTAIVAMLLATATLSSAAAETLTRDEIYSCIFDLQSTTNAPIDIDMVRAHAQANPDCKSRTLTTHARTHEYRMWSAEQMINRVAEKLVRTRKACDQAEWLIGQRLSEKCIANVLNTYPVLGTIREVASSGDPVRWAIVIDAVHTFEAEIEGPLNTLERK